MSHKMISLFISDVFQKAYMYCPATEPRKPPITEIGVQANTEMTLSTKPASVSLIKDKQLHSSTDAVAWQLHLLFAIIVDLIIFL